MRGSERRARVWFFVRLAAGLGYLAYFIQQSASKGLPFDRERLFAWIVGALAVTCIGRPWRRCLQLVIDWIPFVAVLVAYDYSRGLAENVGMPVQVTAQLNVEKFLFFGQVPAVWLQHHLYRPGVIRWWDVPVALTYTSHFVAPFVVAAVLWVRNRTRWRQFVARFVVTSFAAVLTFILVPTAPPWFAANRGHIPHLDRMVGRGWTKIHLDVAEQMIHKGRLVANAVAAIPSLHAAYAFLIAMFFWKSIKRRWLRPILLIHPLMMGFTIVYGGEHYVIDIFAGWLYVWGAFVVCGRVERWWQRRKLAKAAKVDPDELDGELVDLSAEAPVPALS